MNILQRFAASIFTKATGGKFVPGAITTWQAGRNHLPRHNQRAQLAAYKSWIYVCSSRNGATFAETPLRLFATKSSVKTRIIVPHRPISKLQRRHLETCPGIQDLNAVRKAMDIVEITDHIWFDLMQRVNPFMQRFQLLEITQIYQELTGNAYWYVVKNERTGLPVEIWPLPPDRVQIVPSTTDFISHYEYRFGTAKIRFERDEIIHFKMPNPNDLFYGYSPLAAAAEMYNINTNMNRYENALFTNNARPEGVFTTTKSLNDVSYKRLKEEIDAVWRGVINAGKSALLDNDLGYTPISFSPREIGFLKGREWTKSEMFEAYDTPLGLFDPKANRANAEAALFTYMKFGIRPRHTRFHEKLNEWFVPLFDGNMFVAFDNAIPSDKEFELKERNESVKAGIISLDEARIDIGREPRGNGADELRVASNLVPVGSPSQTLVEGLVRRVVEQVGERGSNGTHQVL